MSTTKDWVCRQIKPLDISPVLAVLDRLAFVSVNQGSTHPGKSPCAVATGALLDEFVSFVDSLGLGGETRRFLVRKLGPRQGMAPHVDTWMSEEKSWRRFQVPLVSHPEIKMRWPDDGVEVHLAPGFLYEVKFDRLHEVVNPTDVERTHLQIDQINATI